MSATAVQQAWWREPTKGQWASFFAAWIGWVMDAFDFTVFLLVMPNIAAEFGVSKTATSVSITLTLLVRLLGGLLAGAAADRFGRKLPLMLSVIWFAVCDGAIAFAPSFQVVLILRTLFGFGMGAEWTSGATLAMENWPERSRGIASGVLQGSWAIGYLLAGVVYAYVVPAYGWRALFLVAAIPALLALPIRFWVPESPAFLKGAHKAKTVSMASALSGGGWSKLIWASVVMACGFTAYYAMTALYPSMLQEEFAKPAHAVGGFVSLFNVGMLVGAVGCGILAAKKGPFIAIALPSVLALFVLPLYVGEVAGGLALGAVLGGALGVGSSGVTPLLLTSLFPPEVRARCVGLVYHVGAFLAAFTPTLVASLHDYRGLSLAHAIGFVTAGAEVLLVLALLARPSTAPVAAAAESLPAPPAAAGE